MAKTYAAELLIKNKNAINSLEQVQKKVKAIQKELKKPMTIEAKLGSGFKNIETKINKVAPKTKTIRIEATEDVTKTMNVVQREMFEMSNKIDSTITSSMKGFSSSFAPMIQGANELTKAMSSLSNIDYSGIAKIFNDDTISGLANAAAAAATSTALLNKANTGIPSEKQQYIPKDNSSKDTDKDIEYESWESKSKGGIGNVISHINKHGKRYLTGSYANFGGRIHGATELGREMTLRGQHFKNPVAQAGDDYYELIKKQRASMMKNFGDLGSLSKFIPRRNLALANVEVKGGRGKKEKSHFNGVIREAGLFESKIRNVMNKSSIAVKEFASKMDKSISKGINSAKKKIMSLKATKIFFEAKFKYQRAMMEVKLFASKAKNFITKPFSSIGNVLSKSMPRVYSITKNISKSFTSAFSKIGNSFKRVFYKVQTDANGAATRVVRPWVKSATKIASSITKTIGNAFKKVGSIASNVAKAVATAFGGAVAFGVKDMATQEQYVTSMTHFISVDDAKRNGKNTITMQGAKERADELFNWGTEFANSTPFQNSEVYSAINRMTQVFGYGTDGAQVQKMVKLVGDMAALNPGKTMSDAAEAIADLAVGETERMKEFGLKLTQDDLKALAGVPGQEDTLSQDQIMTAFSEMTKSGGVLFETFDGGADAMANTLSGKFSTVMGKFRQMMVDSMKPFEDIFKGVLDKVIKALSGGFRDNFVNTFSTIASFIGDLMAGDSSNFPVIENLKNAFNTLKDVLGPIFSNIINGWRQIFEAISQRFGGIGGIIEGVANVIANVINGLSPVFNIVGQVVRTFGNIIAQVWPSIQDTIVNVWTNLKPVFELFGNLAQAIADVFTFVWPGIAGVIETLWGTIGPIFEGIAKVLGTIADLANKAFDGIKKVKESKLNPANWFGGDSKQNAYGKNRVPYDGYQASLHEGERILTSRQAAQMDAGLLPGQGSSNNNITINVSGTTDPDTTARMVVQRLKETLENTSVKSFA